METYYNLIATLEYDLKALETNTNNLHTLSEQSISQCKITLQQLRSYREKHPFRDKQSEIEFYKHIKPRVLSYLIFYIKRLHIESKRPKEGVKEEVRHLKKYIAEFQNYFYNNLEFYHYYKSGSTNLDEQYFLNINKTVRLNIEAYHFFTDEQFSCSHDILVAITKKPRIFEVFLFITVGFIVLILPKPKYFDWNNHLLNILSNQQ